MIVSGWKWDALPHLIFLLNLLLSLVLDLDLLSFLLFFSFLFFLCANKIGKTILENYGAKVVSL